MKKLVSLMLVGLFLLAFTGCSEQSSSDKDITSTSLSIVVANNETFPAITNNTVNSIYDEVVDVCVAGINTSGTEVSLVVCDGDPYIAFNEAIDPITVNATASKKQSHAEGIAAQIIRTAADSPAITSEIDMLKALNIASSQVNSSDTEGKTVLVYSNGLQTTGILNMCEYDVLNSDLDTLCEQLISKNAIYDYTGIQFIWIGMGHVSSQTEQVIPNSAIAKLKDLWKAIIEAGGGSVEFLNDYVTGECLENTPTVSLVNFPVDTLDNISANTLDSGVKLDGETLKFKSNLAVFLDEKTAKKTLTPIAEQIKTSGIKILIIGSTASCGSENSCKELSIQRSEACKEILVSLGVDSSQIEVCGVGREPCFLRVLDIDSSGNFIESEAQKNRAVFIYNYDSDTAKEIMKIAE